MRIQGKNIAILIGVPGKEKVVGLSTSCSIDLQTDMIEMASTSDVFREYTPGRHSMSIQIDRLYDTSNTLSMFALQISRTIIKYVVDVEGATVMGEAYISSQKAAGPVDGYATHNISLTCTGEVAVEPNSVTFADALVAQIYDENWGDGESITKEKLAAVTSVGTVFQGTSITTFNEFEQFVGVEKLDPYAFRYCSALKSIKLPPMLTFISTLSFGDCSALTTIDMNNVKQIGIRAFAGCSALNSISIPASVTQIAGYAFAGCNSLNTVSVYPITPPILSAGVFDDLPDDASIVIVRGSAEEYRSSTNWAKYADKIH